MSSGRAKPMAMQRAGRPGGPRAPAARGPGGGRPPPRSGGPRSRCGQIPHCGHLLSLARARTRRPCVSVGQHGEEGGDALFIIESMKLMNEVPSDCRRHGGRDSGGQRPAGGIRPADSAAWNAAVSSEERQAARPWLLMDTGADQGDHPPPGPVLADRRRWWSWSPGKRVVATKTFEAG